MRIGSPAAAIPAECSGMTAAPTNANGAPRIAALGGGPRLLRVHAHSPAAAAVLRPLLAPKDAHVRHPLLFQDRAAPNVDDGGRRKRGQALTEFALVAPIFFLMILSIIVLGLWVFYNLQLENAAREAARYAAVHSTSAQCPTVS